MRNCKFYFIFTFFILNYRDTLSVGNVEVEDKVNVELHCSLLLNINHISWLGPPNSSMYASGYDISKQFPYVDIKQCDPCLSGGSTLVIRNFSNENEGSFTCFGSYKTNLFSQLFYVYLKNLGDIQQYTVTLSNDITTVINRVNVKPTAAEAKTIQTTTHWDQETTDHIKSNRETTSLFSNLTQLFLLIIIIILAILLVCAAAIKGIKAVTDNNMQLPGQERQPQNESEADILQYDEIDIVSSPTSEIISRQQVREHAETDLSTPTTSLSPNAETTVKGTCLSEVNDIFNRQISATSTSSSECSYLNPSRPYMELQQIRNIPYSSHEYEQLSNPEIKICLMRLADDMTSNKPCVKRSTI